MTRVRRADYLLLQVQDTYDLDPAKLLRGELPTALEPRVLALSLLTGERYILSRAELDVLLSVPSHRWVDVDASAEEQVGRLAAMGLLLSDDERGAALRERDEALSATQWNVYAAAYHFMTQWGGEDFRTNGELDLVGPGAEATVEEFTARHGAPPPPFHHKSFGPAQPLPPPDHDGMLNELLSQRRTTRSFDSATPMRAEDLSTVLHRVFGVHGYSTTLTGVPCIKRTSPSGGGLHPIEVYPLVTNVSGIPTGFYHYNVRDHALEQLEQVEQPSRIATELMCGQAFFGDAHVCFVLTARFYRNHWKYRRHAKAYAGVLMDAAHLSQTLYLVSADLGLGAFITLAVNARDIEERLGLDGCAEGVVAMTGCGPRASGESPLELRFAPEPPGQ
jgi:putative peptide maturation dehydrogenase